MPPWILEQFQIFKMAAGKWPYCTNQYNVTVILYRNAVCKSACTLTCRRMFNFIMYADDTTLTSTINTFNGNTNNDNVETSLNAELLKINEWLQINKLSLNISKSKFMIL